MSGPKVSDYELERRRQQALRQKYLEEQQRIQAYQRQQKEFRDEIQQSCSQVERLRAEVSARAAMLQGDPRSRIDSQEVRRISEETDELRRHCAALLQGQEITPQAFERCRSLAAQLSERLLAQNRAVMDERMALDSASYMASLKALRTREASAGQKSRQHAEKQKAETARRTLEAYRSSCTLLASAKAAMPERAEEIQRLQSKLDFETHALHGLAQEDCRAVLSCQHEIEHCIRTWNTERERAQAQAARRTEWVRLYRYYCSEMGLSMLTGEELAGQSEEQMESLCVTLDNALYTRYEENYIYQCINEAMAELGYPLYGQASHGIKGQFLYRMHGNTVVHVSCADNGLISMEVGLASDTARDMDASEVEGLVQDMHTFCGDYARLQQLLAERGVTCRSHIALLPPDPAYALMLDTSQYDLRREQAAYETQRAVRYIDPEE